MKIAGPFVVIDNISLDILDISIAYRKSINDLYGGLKEFEIFQGYRDGFTIWAGFNKIGETNSLQEAKELLDKYLIENDYKICETDEEFEKLAILI